MSSSVVITSKLFKLNRKKSTNNMRVISEFGVNAAFRWLTVTALLNNFWNEVLFIFVQQSIFVTCVSFIMQSTFFKKKKHLQNGCFYHLLDDHFESYIQTIMWDLISSCPDLSASCFKISCCSSLHFLDFYRFIRGHFILSNICAKYPFKVLFGRTEQLYCFFR